MTLVNEQRESLGRELCLAQERFGAECHTHWLEERDQGRKRRGRGRYWEDGRDKYMS